ncbi:MAG: MAC/perforin domain-containing protein [Terriglobia bacterium]
MGDKEGTENPKGTGTGGKPKAGGTPKGVTAVEKTTPLEAFLAEHSIDDKEALDTFKKSKIWSLDDLLGAKTDDKVRDEIEKALEDSGSRFALTRFQKIQVESIKNAKFFLKNPAAKADSKALLDFLAEKDVLVDNNGRDKLLCILLEHNVTSLTSLHKLKADSATKAGNLKDAITEWNADAGTKFAGITAAEVAREAGGEPAEVDEDLRTYLKDTAKLPSGSEAVLAKFGVTSLEQLKGVKQNPNESQGLAIRLQNSGILNAKESFDKITVEDIDEEISTVNAPEVKEAKKEARKKKTELVNAISDVKKLRTRVERATKENLGATLEQVADEYDEVLDRVKDICKVDFEKASTAGKESQGALMSLLDTTLQNAEKASTVLSEAEKTTMPLTKLVRRLEMLCGALVTPVGITMKVQELVLMPEIKENMRKGPGEVQSIDIKYAGNETRSFAFSYASQTGSAIATSAQTAAAGFVGTGVSAVSAAGSYAEARKASKDQETFNSAAVASCGEIRYMYAPKETVQFDQNEIRLSNDAKKELTAIAGITDLTARTNAVKNFYERFGSHYFTRCSLGGRYEFKSTGQNTSASGKEKLVEVVSRGTNWAASASASYVGLGGAVQGASSVIGSGTSAEAQADRMEFSTESARVSVSIKVLGGAFAPRDVWVQSLAFNPTWAVIGRFEPMAIWEIVKRVPQSPALPSNLAPVLEEVWVRETFRDAIRESDPILFSRLGRDSSIKTCESLYKVVTELQAVEPPIEIVVVQETSTSGTHPKVIAQASTKGLKLIGGGARVNYGSGHGSLLTGSYPSGEGWAASAKDHKVSCNATVTAYAVYLVDPEDIWEVRRVEAKSQSKKNRPEATAMLPPGYTLTGGGAQVEGWSKGVLLTHCCPVMKDGVWAGWTAKGKDHIDEDAANATAWAIGIRPKGMLAGNNPEPAKVLNHVVSKERLAAGLAGPVDERVVVGGGAAVDYRDQGGLLTATYPAQDGKAWQSSAKDHVKDDTVGLTTWSISRIGEIKTLDVVKAAITGR